METYTNVRTPNHRYPLGTEVRHADSPAGQVDANIDEQTYRVYIEDGVLTAVATYTLVTLEGEYLEDVADNADLVRA